MQHSEEHSEQEQLAVTHTSAGSIADDPRVTDAMEAYLSQLEAGRMPNREEFLARYPEIADQLEGQLEGLEFLHRLAPQAVGTKTDATDPADDRIGSRATLGDFRLIRQIGRGGMGVVYEAEQLSLGRKVAVKVLPFAAMLDAQHRKRFYNEARAAATLDHPNIVPVYFVGDERGVHFFAMQLINGQSLAEVIDGLRGQTTNYPLSGRVGRGSGRGGHASETLSGPESPTLPKGEYQDGLPSAKELETRPDFHSAVSTQRNHDRSKFFQTAARFGAEAAEALEHAHGLGILHRDIKPGNLLIDAAGKLWVADFGLATIENDETLTRTGGVVGTAAYMSPEQASDSHRIDGRSDVYSLGATLYELLTLRRLRGESQTRADVGSGRDQDRTSLGPVDGSIPADLETIVLKSVSSDPADRYQSAGAMAEDLRSFLGGHEIKARRLTLVQRQARWLRRHRRLTTAAVAASFLLIAAFGTVMSIYSRQLSNNARELEIAAAKAEVSKREAEKQTELANQRLERANRASRRRGRASCSRGE